jgi:murein DD-endopeptidase MepM/ murein hydrolase activator NlpD
MNQKITTNKYFVLLLATVTLCTFFLSLLDREKISTDLPETAHASIPEKVTEDKPLGEYAEQTSLSPKQDEEPDSLIVQGKIKKGDSLQRSLKRQKITGSIQKTIICELKKVLDPTRLRPGNTYSASLASDSSELLGFTYYYSPLKIFDIKKTDSGFTSKQRQLQLTQKTIKLGGIIESSLFASFNKLGQGPKLVYAFSDIFSSQIDFNTETRYQDQFSLVIEKYFQGEKEIGFGKILAVSYCQNNHDPIEGFYYSSEKTPGAFFNRKGRELGTSFLRSPVPVGRVSSRFSFRRKHPILGIVRPHLGIDLAAPHGTPIMAAADGKIKFAGWRNGYGKTIIITHRGGYKTHYGHLSRYAKGLKRGKKVKKRQIIGYVGSTGLSTGPHLDYRIQDQGVFKNPFSLKFKPKSILKGKELAKMTDKIPGYTKQLSLPDNKIIQTTEILINKETEITLL